MSILSIILNKLETPDDQGRDWYGWASNQMSHAFLGVVVALYSSHPILSALSIGALKELSDFIKIPTRCTAIDSANDLAFWVLGAWLVSAHGEMLNVAVAITVFALICGVIPRARTLRLK